MIAIYILAAIGGVCLLGIVGLMIMFAWAEHFAEDEESKTSTHTGHSAAEEAKSILLRLHNAGGCDAKDERSKGWDEAITEAIRIVEEETGMRTEEVLD